MIRNARANPFPWDDHWIERLRHHAQSGITSRQIAAELSKESGLRVTKGVVLGKAHRQDIDIGQTSAPRHEIAARATRAANQNSNLRVDHTDYQPKGCQWIDGDVRMGNHTFCGEPTVKMIDGRKSSFCQAHYDVVYRSPEEKRKQNKFIFSVAAKVIR